MTTNKCFRFLMSLMENTNSFETFCDCEPSDGMHDVDCMSIAYFKDWADAMDDLQELERLEVYVVKNKLLERVQK